MRRTGCSIVIAAGLWLPLAAHAQQRSPSAAAASVPAAPTGGEYVIGADDLLTLVFWRDQQLSGDVLVRPDGKISVPLLDDVQAAGLTPTELRDRLIVEARRFVADPIATVVVKQINSRKVYITGQVSRPGQFTLTPGMTVLHLIATAGGLLDFAKSRDITVERKEQGRSVTLQFDYVAVRKGRGKASANIDLKPGDTVIVP